MFKRTNWKQNDGSVSSNHDSSGHSLEKTVEHWMTGVVVTLLAFGVVIVRAMAQHQ